MTIQFDYLPAVRGDTMEALQVTLTWDETGDPVNLTGAVIVSTFRQCTPDGPSVYVAEIGTGITVNDAVNGVYTVNEFKAEFPGGGTYWFDNEVTLSDGFVTTSVIGTLDLASDVTK